MTLVLIDAVGLTPRALAHMPRLRAIRRGRAARPRPARGHVHASSRRS